MAHGRGWHYDTVQQVYYDHGRNYVIRRERNIGRERSGGKYEFVVYRMTGVDPNGVVFDYNQILGSARRLMDAERLAASL